MSPRSFLLLVAALSLVVSGCSADPQDSGPDEARQAAAAVQDVDVRMRKPVRPLYGERRDGQPWRSAGMQLHRIDRRPYVRQWLVEGVLENEVDDQGVRYYERDGKPYDHPVGIAQYGLAQIDIARRHDDAAALRSAKVNAQRLLDISDEVDGALYFPYPFSFPLGGVEEETIHAPWWSAMAQGQALSLFVRLYEATGVRKWRRAATRTFQSLDDRGPRDAPWSVYIDERGYLWFEEYAGDTLPLLVLNGHMFAMFGIWDYWKMTGSQRAETLFDAGATTLREHLRLFREPGGVSWYCIRVPLCDMKKWQNEKYHGIVTAQMRVIADMVDRPWFRRMANRFQRDFVPEDAPF